MLPEPFYSRDGITIFCGDARDLLPQMPTADAIITDPVWPNSHPDLPGADDPVGLFRDVMAAAPKIADRLVVHLGADSDPRFLAAAPPELPFFRTCMLEYATPSYKGRVLYAFDVAYVFGSPPPSAKGMHLMPGVMKQTQSTSTKVIGHPCPRRYQHVKWLVKWFARGLVIDPFAGSGTTLVAARDMGLPAIGIEINEAFCDIAVRRLQQAVLPLEIAS